MRIKLRICTHAQRALRHGAKGSRLADLCEGAWNLRRASRGQAFTGSLQRPQELEVFARFDAARLNAVRRHAELFQVRRPGLAEGRVSAAFEPHIRLLHAPA
jgi:hypothetical protein